MSSGRSTRSQARRPAASGGHEDYHHEEMQVHHEMHPGMNMMMGNMEMAGGGWHQPMEYQHPQEGFLGYNQYQHNVGAYSHGHQQQQHQYYQVQDAMFEGGHEEPIPCSSRSLRARNSGATATATSMDRKGPTASTSASAGPSTSAGAQAIASGDDDTDDGDNEQEVPIVKRKPHKMVDTSLTVDDMMHNCLYYLLLHQHKKIPVKRSDLVKHAMNSQHKQFADVIRKLQVTLNDVFGMELVRIVKGKDNQPCIAPGAVDGSVAGPEEEGEEPIASGKRGKGKGTSNASASYIVVSKFPSSVFDSSMYVMGRRDPEADTKKTVLYLILSTIFMLNQAIDEEIIWKIIIEMQFDKMVCERRDEMRKFLKSEYVSTGYLNIETTENQNHPNAKHSSRENDNEDEGDKPRDMADITNAKYSWGPRAHKEYSKYAMLKFVVARFPGRKMYEFTVQYNMVRYSPDIIDKDFLRERETDDEEDRHEAPTTADGENGSAINIKKKGTGARTRETFSIDGENTETETEGGE